MLGARKPRWTVWLLDESDNRVRVLRTVEGGAVSVVAQSRLGGSGDLTLVEQVDWLSARCQIVYDPGTGDSEWPVATMLFTSPETTYEATRTVYDVQLLSKMSVVDEDTVEATYSLAAGVNIIDTVVSLILSTGETRIAVTPSDATLTNPLVWDAGESKLTIINELLQAAGYWSLWCDGSGMFRVEPWRAPAERVVSWTFTTDQTSIVEAGHKFTQDMSSVPNKFVVVGEGDDETPPLIGVATNTDPGSPYSWQSRGRWITHTETGVEADSQEVIDQIAKRRLLDAMSPVGKISVTHGIVPLEPDQLVVFRDGDEVRATVQRMKFTLDTGSQCDAEWRLANV